MVRAVLHTLPVIFAICLVWLSLPTDALAAGSSNGTPDPLGSLLKAHHGRVLVLLMGRDGCSGTAKATTLLHEYASTKPQGVSIVRLDVPLLNETLKLSSEWKHPFPRSVDTGRRIADRLDFFYYPTLYVFDRQGEERYVGGCDMNKLPTMVREILAEKPGSKKKIYTQPMPAVGESAPSFTAKTLAGNSADLKSLLGKQGLLILFARTSCGFCRRELANFNNLAERFRGEGVNVVIINQGEDLDAIRPVYEKDCASMQVLWDQDGAIFKSFGVDAVPFYFLLDADGKVIGRRSFTHPAAANAINALLGQEAEKTRYKPTEGG